MTKRKETKRRADCHVNLPHHAKGLCRDCYKRATKQNKRESKVRKIPSCHPEELYFGKGFCEKCYNRKKYNGEIPGVKMAKCHPGKANRSNGLCQYCYNKKIQSSPDQKKKKRAYQRRYYRNNKDNQTDYFLKRKYGVSLSQYKELLEEQGGVCAICKRVNHTKNKLAVDHNHKTGNYRGLLCSKCNTALGQLDENIDYMLAMIGYISKFKD